MWERLAINPKPMFGMVRKTVWLLSCVLLAQSAFAQQAPSQILNQYRAQRTTWMTNVWPFANNLFFWLALIEFTWSAAIMLLEKHDLQSWTAALVRRVMWIGAFYALLLNGRNWIPTIIDSFNILGQRASGAGPMSPTDVFMRGVNIAGALMDGASSSAFFTNPGTCLACIVAAALTVISFIFITIQFVVAMVESYIIVAAGVIFLGFGGSRWTAPYVERYIGLGVANGVKIMLLYLLIGVGMDISLEWIPDAQAVSTSATPAMNAFEVMGAALIFLMLCWQIPKLFSAVLGGAPALTGGDLVSTGAAVVTGAVAVGSLAAAGMGAAAGAGAAAGGGGAAGSSSSTGSSGLLTGVTSARSAGGGSAPPPPSPSGGGGNGGGLGGPRQPEPPRFGGSNGNGAGTSTVPGPAPSYSGSYGSSGSTRNASGGGSPNASSVHASQPSSAESDISSIGGEQLAGSGFEGERPLRGFVSSVSSPNPKVATVTAASTTSNGNPTSSETSGSGSTPASGASDVASVGSARPVSNTPPTGSQRVKRAASQLTGRVWRYRSVMSMVPSDAAPHATPPRMPIDQTGE